MNFRAVSRVLAGLVAFLTAAQLLPLALAVREGSGAGVSAPRGFLAGIATGAVVAALLWGIGRRAQVGFHRRETLVVGGVSWFVASLLGAIPYQFSGLLPDFADAVFESVSGLTTCGGTVLGTAGNPTPEATPHSLLLWRALQQWLGGIGIVMIFIALLPSGSASQSLLVAESVGIAHEGYRPRLLAQARWTMAVYALLSVACIGTLLLASNMDVFDAVCHSFSALATGGYSTRTSVATFDDLGAEVVLTVFMFLGGCSFALMAGALRDGAPGLATLARTAEFRFYAVFTCAAVAVVTVDLVRRGLDAGSALRQASFNTVSMLSCCGFATVDFHAWPPMSLLAILTCCLVGGCSGSAAGGFKQVRLLIVLRLVVWTLRGFVQPKRVETMRLDGEPMSPTAVCAALAIVLLWLMSVLGGALVIACDQRLSALGALTASASMLGNCGPAMANVHPDAIAAGLPAAGVSVGVVGPNIGPLGGYGDLAGWTKCVLCFLMVLGRLELLPLLALFYSRTWGRR